VDATARFAALANERHISLIEPLLRGKYGLLKRGLDGLNAAVRAIARRPKPAAEYVEILPADR
jgi:hypothetical protein